MFKNQSFFLRPELIMAQVAEVVVAQLEGLVGFCIMFSYKLVPFCKMAMPIFVLRWMDINFVFIHPVFKMLLQI
jgi:hypothetical protein